MNIKKYINVFCWNWGEFTIYLLVAAIPLILGPTEIISITLGSINISYDTFPSNFRAVIFSVFLGIFFVRYFDKLKEEEKLIDVLQQLNDSVSVWIKGFSTLQNNWVDQLTWLQFQVEVSQLQPAIKERVLYPHPFHVLSLHLLDSIPNKIGAINSKEIRKFKGSIISINHKIENLNFMLQKLHLRESLDEKERKEIIGLISKENPYSVISVLKNELPNVHDKTKEILVELGENEDKLEEKN